MLCDMCASKGKLYKAIVEGAELNVCSKCSKFGKIVGVVKQNEREKIILKKEKHPEKENIEMVIGGYAERIRKKRDSIGLTQEEFAKNLSEKESLIQKIESGHFEPSIALAKKIGRFLKIRLIEQYEERYDKPKHSKMEAFTLGDFIKIKNK